MNNDTIKRLEALEKSAQEEFSKAKRGLTVTCIGYAVLFIVVVAYTTVAYKLITSWATPETISAMAITYAKDQLPLLKNEIGKQTKENAPVIADRLVSMVHSVIPQAENFAKTQIDMAVDTQLEKFRNEYMPELTLELKKTLKDAEKSAKPLTEPGASKEYADFFADTLDAELAKILDENAKKQMAWLRDELGVLKSKPASRMTAKELAEKRLVIYWLFLVNNAEVGDSAFSSYLKTVSAFAEHIDSFFIDDSKVELK